MRHVNKVDLGEVQIHKKVIGDIAAAALKDIPGVHLARFGILGSLCDIFGYSNYPGVMVHLDKDGFIALNIRIVLDYGINVQTVARQIQDNVHKAVLDAVDIELQDINVNVHAVQRGGASCG